MKEHFIDLTDGTRLGIKLNFATLYYLQKSKAFYSIVKRMKKAEQRGVPAEKVLKENESFELAANIIYAVLRSNGKNVTFDEALSLVPPDADDMRELLQGFQDEYERYRKKKQARMSVAPK